MNRKKYNVLFIMSDQQRRDSLGCYGNKQVQTPHIDALAAQGMRFDHAYTPLSVCSPARASVLTGLYPHSHGAVDNAAPIDRNAITIPDALIPNGYRCGFAGKWHIDQQVGPTGYGFEGKDFIGYAYPPSKVWKNMNFGNAVVNPVNYYYEYLMERHLDIPELEDASYVKNTSNSTRELYGLQGGSESASSEEASVPYFVAEETNALIEKFTQRKQKDGKPFFIWSNFWGPHNPCFIPEPWYSMYDPESIEVETYDETNESQNKPRVQQQLSKYWGFDGDDTKALWQQNIAKYWGYSSLIDAQVGRMREKLKEVGEDENTIIIYTTDHGDMCGHHNLIDKGPFMYDDTYRIPFVVYHPDQKGPLNHSEAFIYLHDLPNTLAELAGIPNTFPDQGQSFLPLLNKQEAAGNEREEVYCEFFAQLAQFPQRMVREKCWKFIYNRSEIGELYDTENDPQERWNLFEDPQYDPIKKRLMKKLLDHMERTDDPLTWWYKSVIDTY